MPSLVCDRYDRWLVVQLMSASVEAFLHDATSSPGSASGATVIVDPPRTGMSKDALAGIIALQPPGVVYVSCDIATLARDTRTLVDAGYQLHELMGFDMFPNTAHVESVAFFAPSSILLCASCPAPPISRKASDVCAAPELSASVTIRIRGTGAGRTEIRIIIIKPTPF